MFYFRWGIIWGEKLSQIAKILGKSVIVNNKLIYLHIDGSSDHCIHS